MTLEALEEEKLISEPPPRTTTEIADDGTGKAEAALGYIHVNCGVSCHNANENAKGYSSRIYVKLRFEDLDGGPPSGDWEIVASMLGVPAKEPQYNGRTRVVPGVPEESLVVELMKSRDASGGMPSIGTKLVDEAGVATIEEWIREMP